MSKRPNSRAVQAAPDALTPGSRVRVTWGAHNGETGVVTQVFRRSGEAHSTVHVKGIPSSNWVVDAFPLSCVEVVR